MFLRICGFSFASAASDVVVTVVAMVVVSVVAVDIEYDVAAVVDAAVAAVVAALVAAVVVAHVLYLLVVAAYVVAHVLKLHVAVRDAALIAIDTGRRTARNLVAWENLQWTRESIALTISHLWRIQFLRNNSAQFWGEHVAAGC